MEELNRIQECIHHRFDQVKYALTALTHSSYANELEEDVEHNERLEFLGDAVLELCVSEELFKRFPDVREGELTRTRAMLVSKPTLAIIARDLGLDRALLLGRGEESQGGRDRDSVLSDTVEALLGAVFMDGGFEAAKRVVLVMFERLWPEAPGRSGGKDNKSALQELTQRLFKDRPTYTLVGSEGPEHDKRFTVSLILPDGKEVTAQGRSVKRAEQKAAANAIKIMERMEEPGE